MSNAVYPVLPGLMWPIKRTPLWRTSVKTTPSGRTWRRGFMLYPRYRRSLQYEFLRSAAALAEYQTLFGFFNARGGGADSFLFQAGDDFSATGQPFGVGNAAATQWQLVRTLGGFVEPVYDIDTTAGLALVYIDGVLKTKDVHYTLSPSGLVTFAAPPASGAVLTWTGRYYWRCCFESDDLQFEQFMAQFWRTGEVHLITEKP